MLFHQQEIRPAKGAALTRMVWIYNYLFLFVFHIKHFENRHRSGTDLSNNNVKKWIRVGSLELVATRLNYPQVQR